MPANTDIEDQLNDIGHALQREPSMRRDVMQRVTKAAAASPPPAARRHSIFGRIAAVAACVIAAAVLWAMLGGNGGPGPQEAFAAAIANIEHARTFSARGISKSIDNGNVQVREMAFMFKEPNRERFEYRQGMPIDGETTIRDYGTRQELRLNPDDQEAERGDLRGMYQVDEKTGELKPIELSTRVRDEVVRISAQAVKDAGMEKLDGRDARVLRSDDGREPMKTVWVDPKNGKPMQIKLTWKSGATYTYAGIRIDEDLDDALFSLDPPKGYTMAKPKESAPPTQAQMSASEMNGKMLSKMKYLVMACYKYSDKHGNEFPNDLNDLTKGGTSEKALRALLAAPDDPNGPAVIRYRKPRKGSDSNTEIVVYEAEDFRRDGKVIAGMWDGHSQVLDAKEFEQMMK